MAEYVLGIDTSNYTTSAALYSKETGEMFSKTQLLHVEKGQKGLRQSDAVFLHNKNLPPLLEELLDGKSIKAVGVSDVPRRVTGSYMPCFLVGEGYARAVAAALQVPLYRFSHQQGHVVAALYGANRLDLIDNDLIAFHISGGTTECLSCENGGETITILGKTLDLSAGQLIDRTGVLLGLDFPCGSALEALALKSKNKIPPKKTVNGRNINFSGLENIVKTLFDNGEAYEEIAAFVLNSVLLAIETLTQEVRQDYSLPLIYSGGVMSCSILKNKLTEQFGGIFAPPEFSKDNAAGIAVLTSYRG